MDKSSKLTKFEKTGGTTKNGAPYYNVSFENGDSGKTATNNGDDYKVGNVVDYDIGENNYIKLKKPQQEAKPTAKSSSYNDKHFLWDFSSKITGVSMSQATEVYKAYLATNPDKEPDFEKLSKLANDILEWTRGAIVETKKALTSNN
jgi:hypothetical protein